MPSHNSSTSKKTRSTRRHSQYPAELHWTTGDFVAKQQETLSPLHEDLSNNLISAISVHRFSIIWDSLPSDQKKAIHMLENPSVSAKTERVMRALVQYAKKQPLRIHQIGEEAMEARECVMCPNWKCEEKFKGDVESARKHMRKCRKTELEGRKGGKVSFCYPCRTWILASRLDVHNSEHLEHVEEFFDCGELSHGKLLLQPSRCPFCLGNETHYSTMRLQGFASEDDLIEHLIDHVDNCAWPVQCPHPACRFRLRNRVKLTDHFCTTHGLSYERSKVLQDSQEPSNSDDGEDLSDGQDSDPRSSESSLKDLIEAAPEDLSYLLNDQTTVADEIDDSGDEVDKLPNTADVAEPSSQPNDSPRCTSRRPHESLGDCAYCDEKMTSEWVRRGLPEIDWKRIPARTRELVPWLETCLESRSVPIFRQQYITSGIDDFCCGYYGGRATGIIGTQLIKLMKKSLKAATIDPVVGKNLGMYVSGCLVLAVIHRFVMEDLGQNSEVAASTMRETEDLGLFFNEDDVDG